MEKAVSRVVKADALLQAQQQIQDLKAKERALLAEVAQLKHEKTVEQEQAATIKQLQAEVNERKSRSIADAVSFMRNLRR